MWEAIWYQDPPGSARQRQARADETLPLSGADVSIFAAWGQVFPSQGQPAKAYDEHTRSKPAAGPRVRVRRYCNGRHMTPAFRSEGQKLAAGRRTKLLQAASIDPTRFRLAVEVQGTPGTWDSSCSIPIAAGERAAGWYLCGSIPSTTNEWTQIPDPRWNPAVIPRHACSTWYFRKASDVFARRSWLKVPKAGKAERLDIEPDTSFHLRRFTNSDCDLQRPDIGVYRGLKKGMATCRIGESAHDIGKGLPIQAKLHSGERNKGLGREHASF